MRLEKVHGCSLQCFIPCLFPLVASGLYAYVTLRMEILGLKDDFIDHQRLLLRSSRDSKHLNESTQDISSSSYQNLPLLIRFLRLDYLVAPKHGQMCPIRYGPTSSDARQFFRGALIPPWCGSTGVV
jgi:hypothetical protein